MKTRRTVSRFLAVTLSAAMMLPASQLVIPAVNAASNDRITYEFSGIDSNKAGYAEGTITLTADAAGTYKLYWANDEKALDGYYPIGELNLKSGKSGSVSMGYHTAIPADATKIIATTGSLNTADAYSVYTIPEEKLLSSTVTGSELYSFSSYSDLHIDKRSGTVYWKRSENNLRDALDVSTDRGADYIVVSGDIATGENLGQEWQTYQKLISQSDFVNPVWESNGNHDFKKDESNYDGYGNEKFVQATGTDGSDSSRPYFYMVEKKTGDIFLFMALESGTPNKNDVFSKAQIDWAKSVINQYYGSRNIFLVQHAPVRGFCAGDDLNNPYYGGLMNPDKTYNAQFKQMLIDYPDITFLSGHTHEDFSMDYNYFDNGGNAANMIHTPALCGSTFPDPDNPGSLTYSGGDCDSCQGYHVQVFENEIVFNGLNVTEDKIFPKYTYIMEGSRKSSSEIINTEKTITMTGETVSASGILTNVSSILSSKYTYASYDAYQNLKKLYYEYKGQATFDKAVLDEFNSRIADLGKHTGGIVVYPVRQTYYFTNNKKWTSVYAYAWSGSSKNAEWPGVKLSKVGTNSSNEDIYAVNFNSAGEFSNLIFNSGSGGVQTVDITLCEYEKNAFYVSGTESGKCTVGNWSYDGGDDPGPEPDHPVNGEISYTFSGEQAARAGYAEGTLSLNVDTTGKYKLYWADDEEALDGYYPIAELSIDAGKSKSVSFGYHTAIPAGATKVIATTGSLNTSDAFSVYTIPENKRLDTSNGNLLYSFSTYSDIHIDDSSDNWYKGAKTNLGDALSYSNKKGADFIVVSGDCVTNNEGPDQEWLSYQKILSQSDFVGPIWESDGNHEIRWDAVTGIEKFIKATGTDGSESGKSYFAMTEPKTGDLFIFMALELNFTTHHNDEFSDEQLAFVRGLLEENYGKRNIFILQHSPVEGFGAGDDMTDPYYGGLLTTDKSSVQAFKDLMIQYPDVMFMSGHTHEDFAMDFNYVDYYDGNKEAANMIHTPALAGSKMPKSGSSHELDGNGGWGYNSQGYHVEVYPNEIVFYGANITDEKIYPLYSYVMEGSRTESSQIINTEKTITMTGETVSASEMLSEVSSILSTKYTYSSYDAYQSLKKLYYEYKGKTTFDKAVLDEFESRIADLEKHTGSIVVNPLRQTYYFTNNKKWSSVYAYAWTGSNKNAAWPGVKLSKVGTNSSNEDIYVVNFNSAGEFEKLIFNSGSGGTQTVNIELCDYEKNAFYISGTENGKCTVGNWSYDGGDDPGPEPPTPTDSIYLNYYISGEHNWDNYDTKFTAGEDGIYRYTFTSKGTTNLSFGIYNKTAGKYICVPESIKPTYEEGVSATYDLTASTTRGKSITVYGLSSGKKIGIEYDQKNSTVTVTFGEKPEPVDPLANESTVSATDVNVGESVTITGAATGGNGNYSYAYWYCMDGDEEWTYIGTGALAVFTPNEAGTYQLKAIVSDVASAAEKVFVITAESVYQPLENTSTINSDRLSLGQRVYYTGSATGGTAPYIYSYYYKRESGKVWKALGKENVDTTSIAFAPTALDTYDIKVTVTDAEGATADKTFKVKVVDGKSTAFENTSTVSTTGGRLGTKVKLYASAAGSDGYTYAYYYKRTTARLWKVLGTEFGTSAAAQFTPTDVGEFNVRIDVKDKNGEIVSRTFAVSISDEYVDTTTVIELSADKTSAPANSRITVTAAATGSTAPYQYAFYYKRAEGNSWNTVGTGYSETPSASVKFKAAGDIIFKVCVKDANGGMTSKNIDVTITD